MRVRVSVSGSESGTGSERERERKSESESDWLLLSPPVVFGVRLASALGGSVAGVLRVLLSPLLLSSAPLPCCFECSAVLLYEPRHM